MDPLAVLALSQEEREERTIRLREEQKREEQESRAVSDLIDGDKSEEPEEERPEN